MARKQTQVYLYTNFNILINNLHPTLKLPVTNNSIKSLVSLVMKGEDCAVNEIVVNFVDNKEIRRLNKKYLKHDYFTDILTFPYNESQNNIEGEIFISSEMVKNNGIIYKQGYKRELKRVIIHGCLHLAGYRDSTKKQKELIRAKEEFYLSS